MNALNAALPVPPQSIDSEQALLGAILHNNEALDPARDHVVASDFYDPVHRHIFEVMCQRRDAGEAIDFNLMKAVLGEADLGGFTVGQYLARLISEAVTVSGASSYARLVAQAARMRVVMETAQAAVAAMAGGSLRDPAEHAAHMIEVLDGVSSASLADYARRVSLRDSVSSALVRVEQTRQGLLPRGVPYGLPKLDFATLGMRPGQLVVLAGRPGMGKTAGSIARAADPNYARLSELRTQQSDLRDALADPMARARMENFGQTETAYLGVTRAIETLTDANGRLVSSEEMTRRGNQLQLDAVNAKTDAEKALVAQRQKAFDLIGKAIPGRDARSQIDYAGRLSLASASGKGSSGSESRDDYDRAVRSAEDRMRRQAEEAATFGMSAGAVARYRTETELLTAAKRAERDITPSLTAQIDGYAQKAAAAAEQQEKLRDSMREMDGIIAQAAPSRMAAVLVFMSAPRHERLSAHERKNAQGASATAFATQFVDTGRDEEQ